MRIIDAKNAVLGRLSSNVAKALLNGDVIVVVNAERAIVTGNPRNIKEKYMSRRIIGSPQHGPFFPMRPELIVRRTIRSMVPYKTPKGRAAMKRLKVYTGAPEGFEKGESIAAKPIRSDFINVGEIAKSLGHRK